MATGGGQHGAAPRRARRAPCTAAVQDARLSADMAARTCEWLVARSLYRGSGSTPHREADGTMKKPSSVRSAVLTVLTGALFVAVGCASDPPPPPATPAAPPPAEAMAPPPAEAATAPVEETPAPPPPECQAVEDCFKAHGEAATGMVWSCEAGACASQAAPEPPKPEPVAETPKKGKAGKGAKPAKKGN